MAGLNAWAGWGLSTLALFFLNKGSNSANDSSFDPESLNVNSNQTKIGSPVPVVMGRCLVKSPLVIYFGDFRADRYTETYAAHAEFSAWPIILSALAVWASTAVSGHVVTQHTHSWAGANAGGPVGGTTSPTVPPVIANKEDVGPQIMMMFAQWLLAWLINGRNLKTTMQKGFKYYLGYQMLVCWSGDEMRIRAIYLKEKKVWEGDASATKQLGAPYIVRVNDDELFGGPDEQGGFVGELHAYLGGRNQGTDTWMVKQMQAESIQAELRGLTPAYRPFVSVVVPTAYIGKSATIPETWIELQNCPNRLGLGAIGEDANPAEVLYEIHVNTDWGLAENPNLIDKEALIEIGKVLEKEKIGISVQLGSKTQAQSLIDNICEHINAMKYADPRTGKLTFKLIRNDYDENELLRLGTYNCSKISYARLDWSETISTISVAYTDREAQYEQSTIPAVDPANIEINNGIETTKTYSYTYFTNSENALWAARRELNQQGYPLSTVSIEGNRKLSNIRVGEVIVLDWPPYGIKNLLLRVTDVDFGDFVEGIVKIEAIEDIFGLEKTEFGFSGSTDWTPSELYPKGVQVFAYLEMPWELCQSSRTFVSAFAARPDEKDTTLWTVWRQKEGEEFESTSSLSNWTAAGRLVYDYAEFTDAEDVTGFEIAEHAGIKDIAAESTIDFTNARRGGNLIMIDDEIMAYSALLLLPNGHWYVKGVLRGVFDTVPKKHMPQSNVLFIRSSYYANVTTGGPVCGEGETTTEHYNITTSTVDHDEEFDHLRVRQFTTCRRSELPCVPGRVRMAYHLQDESIHTKKIAGKLTLSWIVRNKTRQMGCVSQDDKTEYWTKQPFEAPEGSCSLVQISVGSKTKDYITTAEDVESFTYPWEQRCLDFANLTDDTRIELYAKQGELLSYQAQERSFSWAVPVMADAVIDTADGEKRLNEWGISDRLQIPAGVYCAEMQVLYANMPIILLGDAAVGTNTSAVLCYDGGYIKPNGKVMIVKSATEYDLYDMQNGFVFDSYIVATGGKTRYQWNGNRAVKL